MHNIVAIKLKSNSHDQQKCKMIKTLVLLVCQLILTNYIIIDVEIKYIVYQVNSPLTYHCGRKFKR